MNFPTELELLFNFMQINKSLEEAWPDSRIALVDSKDGVNTRIIQANIISKEIEPQLRENYLPIEFLANL